jgi:ubiquinone/menaquinone biosynthesis C-methylase UbiE
MGKIRSEEPDYGNWVSKRLIYVSGGAGAILLGLSSVSLMLEFSAIGLLSIALLIVFLISIVAGVFLIIMSVYFAYARHKFSPRGGNVQAQIEELVLRRLDWDGKGKALDIGCGNGPLTIVLAKKFPKARVTGIDYWGGNWEYSKGVCEKNAEIQGVASQVKFQKASASALPFKGKYFDAAVSNLVFHEVKDTRDKRDVVKEALRVVKKGGKFAFQDLFLVKRLYGDVDDLLKAIRSWGVKSVKFIDTSHSDFIPRALRLSFMVGTIGILYGKK